ncbi:MAG: peptidoglycan DD-metalloendopeptidase family protein, partial [Chloroflexi bacterium]|nr:peptidoglycan DD-metalloendopeptidase family protein [Chloroflexota bacterium]
AGDTLAGIAAQFNTTETAVAAANHLIAPNPALTVGDSLAVISRTGSALSQSIAGTPHIVAGGEGLLAIAARYGLSIAELATANGLLITDYLYSGQRLRIPSDQPYRDLPGEWVDVRIRPFPITQGSTVSIFVKNLLDGVPSGQLVADQQVAQSLRFFPHEDGYAALVGLDAFTEPGIYTLELMGSSLFRQRLRVQSSGYGEQYIIVGEELSHLLAPEIRAGEDAALGTIYNQFSETQQWDGLFQSPVTNTVVTAQYGDARSYNGGPFEIFHTGVDFSGGVGTPILAPANGVVMYADEMALHGATMVVDHGLGVMSAYFHLDAFLVAVGETVAAGQPIAKGGGTGLSTGPHLHWELRVNNVAVNGLQWTQGIFP